MDEQHGNPEADIATPEEMTGPQLNALLEVLAKKDPQLEYLQVAQNGEWGNALKFEPNTDPDTLNLNEITDPNTALEAFFRLSDNSHAFIGFKLPEQATEPPAEFIRLLTRSIANSPQPTEALRAAGLALSGDTDTYTARSVDRVVAMVVDYYKELPTEVVWRHGEPALTPEVMKAKIEGSQELLANDKNYIALEVDFGAPGLWMGVQVSEVVEGKHQLDESKVAEVLSALATKQD